MTNKHEIDLTPDFSAMYRAFDREARLQAEGLRHRLTPPVADTADAWAEAKVEILRAVQGLLAPLSICAQCATRLDDVLRLRDLLSHVVAQVQQQADTLEDKLQAEDDEEYDGDCDCIARSWYGKGHDSACPVTLRRNEAEGV